MRLLSLIITSIVIANCCFAEDNQEIYKELCGYWRADPNSVNKLIEQEVIQMLASREYKTEEEKLKDKTLFYQQSQAQFNLYLGYILEFKKDKSMVRFPSLALCKDRRFITAGQDSLFFKIETQNKKIKVIEIQDKQLQSATEPTETEIVFDGRNLIFGQVEPVINYIKMDPNDPLISKPKILGKEYVKISPPSEFSKTETYEPGLPIERYLYSNPQNQANFDEIELSFELLLEQVNIGLDASHKQRLEFAYKIYQEHEKYYPDKFEFTKLDGEEVIVCSQTAIIDNKQYYIKKYLVIDDGYMALNITIIAPSLERLKVLDESVKTIKFNMYAVWN